ncbi:MAG: 50S ribosomal protein L6 [Planctomycetota bacterium]|nr:50S ribosomal protein L6 [Planctomycetota bacterium]
MSRIGKKPVPIPDGVQVSVAEGKVTIKGPKGQLALEMTGTISAKVEEKAVQISRGNDLRMERAKHGLYRALIANMVFGVTKGYEKRLEIQGVGYRAQVSGRNVLLYVGWNTKVPQVYQIPEGITVTCPTQTEMVIQGIDKQLVGQVAASLRAVRPPDAYKGKGIRYQGEYVRKLPGKTVGATGA